MTKPRTVNQLLRSLGLSVSLAGAGAPACESRQPPARDGGPRDLLIENPAWRPETEGDLPRDYVVENPPWNPPEPQPDGGPAADAGDAADARDAADVKEAGPTDLPYVAENPAWVPEVNPADKPEG